jgi:hypothetical protein
MRRVLERNPRVKILFEFFPERIRRSGRDAAQFLDSIAAMGFRIQRIGPRGRLHPLPKDTHIAQDFLELFLSR